MFIPFSQITAGVDYIPVVRILDFAPGEMTKTLTVTILDDLGHQVIEGAEKFELHLREPVGGSMGEPSLTTVTINDSVSDCKLCVISGNIVGREMFEPHLKVRVEGSFEKPTLKTWGYK
jgi:hypothetical protein